MKTTLKMPRVSDTVDQVIVVDVSVTVGSQVEKGAIVITVDADKATVEIPAPATGTITAVFVKPDNEISTGDPIISIEA